ncbi:MAG: restriction endonuclease subunit S [Moraxella sp.]
MRRYESYKDSGVEWLGEVPSHWDVQRSKFIFKKIERKVNEEDQIVTCFRDGQVTLRANRRTEGFTNALKEHGYQGIRKGDLVIHAMDAFAGAIGISDSDGKATPVYSVCLPHNKQKIDVYFYAYYLRNLALSGFISSLAKGIRERSTDFRYADFAELLLPIPPYLEQQKIAQFLDDKTAKIDQAVDLAEKQIALLKEHKQILIQNAVTRGLNPDVLLKDSGVEWIGQVPEHWEVKQLKFEAHITLGKMLCTEYKHGFHLKPYLKSKNIQWLNVDTSSIDEMYFSSYELALYKLEKGDLILSEGGEVGKTCMWNNELDECYIQNSAHKVRLYKKNNNKYFLYLFFSCGHLGVFDSIVNRVSIAHLTKDKLENMKFIFPTLAEQTAIADYLDKQTAKIDQAIALKTAHIEKLKEYKSVLINDVVTGKVRVSV